MPKTKVFAKTKRPPTPAPAPLPPRGVCYPEVAVQSAHGDSPLTAATARLLLDWQAETDDAPFGDDYLLLDEEGCKVRCHNNVSNRPLYKSTLDTLKQEILRRRWRLNGEPVIIGQTGLVLNGQHTLIALVLAEQARTGGHHLHWEKLWPHEVAIDKLVVVGIDESDETVNTMDTAKPRSLKDVIYRSHYFRHCRESDRRVLARMAEHAVKLLWFRTGATGLDQFMAKQTHAEALDFLSRHDRLLAAIRHVYEEDRDRFISRYISPGYASALLYLMGCSASDPERYRNMATADERVLDWRLWDRACEFWVLLRTQSGYFLALRTVLTALLNVGTASARAEKLAVLAKAWKVFAGGEAPRQNDLELSVRVDEEGVRHLINPPTFGGIDQGDPATVDGGASARTKDGARSKSRRILLDTNVGFQRRRSSSPPEPSATVADAGSPDGKPPAPVLRKTADETIVAETAQPT